MAVSTTTRTHLIYQFIILTLLFLSIGYNELLPDRKFILFLAFIPIFCYQLVILSCCMELMPVPRWMGFLGSANVKCDSDAKEFKCNSEISSLASTSTSSQTQIQKELNFPDASEMPCQRRWEKSVTNLGVSPKYSACPQKSKSWMSLNDSKSAERLLNREGSFDVLALCEKKCSSRIKNKSDKTNREKRAVKAKSWKPFGTNFETSEKAEIAKSTSMESAEPLSNSRIEVPQEESELSKSYSFPFRQKRLETWLEMKETSSGESNQSLDMPYWKTVGYNLAVKYEARRRRIVATNPTKSELPCEDAVHTTQKHVEVSTGPAHTDKHNSKKCAKSASACINKIKAGFSNLIAKKKDELPESSNNGHSNRISKSNLLLKLKNKNISFSTKEKERSADMPEFPQFLSNDRPLIFYPRYLPFEKERFESDVNKKMKELDEQKTNCNS